MHPDSGLSSAPPGGRRAAFVLITVAALALFTEGAARALLGLQSHVRRAPPGAAAGVDLEAAGKALDLDPFEMIDPSETSNWRLRPGARMTLAQVIDAKRRDGHVLAVPYLEERARLLGVESGDTVVAIDDDGYRGPAIDRGHSRFRILAIGDSCTFGTTLGESYPYPRVVERELRRRGRDVEVINAGVKGYGVQNVLLRIEEFKALKPELTTVYLGWNELYSETFFSGLLVRHSAALRLLHEAYAQAMRPYDDRTQQALAAYRKAKHPDPNAPEVAALDEYTPLFMRRLVKVVDEMQSAGSRVVLLTLPGLYSTSETPDARALEKGHLPLFTDNPYVLARMVERYDECLRDLGRSRGLQVIDLETWSRTALVPRADHFFDSVHLYEESQGLVGARIAEELLPQVP